VNGLRAAAKGTTATIAAAVVVAVIATAGLAFAAVQPAAADSSTCSIKTDVNIDGTWTNWCGLGDHVLNTNGEASITALDEIRDATAPYHRVWLHGYLDPTDRVLQPWTMCIYSHHDVNVSNLTIPGLTASAQGVSVLVGDVLVTANTNPC
jgi:hypothetical protein